MPLTRCLLIKLVCFAFVPAFEQFLQNALFRALRMLQNKDWDTVRIGGRNLSGHTLCNLHAQNPHLITEIQELKAAFLPGITLFRISVIQKLRVKQVRCDWGAAVFNGNPAPDLRQLDIPEKLSCLFRRII